MSLYYMFTARHHSMMMISGPPGTFEDPTFRPNPFFTREEFDVYDGIKMMTTLSFFFFCKFIALGKWGRWATWWKKSEFQARMMKKSIFLVCLMIIVSVLMGYQGHYINSVVMKAHKEKVQIDVPQIPTEDDQIQMPGQEEQFTKPYSRNLIASEDFCNTWDNQGDCDARDCNWCSPVDTKYIRNCHSFDYSNTLSRDVYTCSHYEKSQLKVTFDQNEGPSFGDVRDKFMKDLAKGQGSRHHGHH